jgi:hypothetical protein
MAEEYKEAIAAYQIAKDAVRGFDEGHKAIADVLIVLGKMLEKGGWAAVELDSDDERLPEDRRVPGNFEQPVILGALRSIGGPLGISPADLVMERRRLVRDCKRAYAAIPADIRDLHLQETAKPKPRGRQRRG